MYKKPKQERFKHYCLPHSVLFQNHHLQLSFLKTGHQKCVLLRAEHRERGRAPIKAVPSCMADSALILFTSHWLAGHRKDKMRAL